MRDRSTHSIFLIDTCVVFFSTSEIKQALDRVFQSITESDDGLRRLYRATNSHLLRNCKPPAMHKLIELRAFPLNAHFNYSAAPRTLKLYQTVYSLKTRRRSFTRPLFLNDATVYGVYLERYEKGFFDAYCTSTKVLRTGLTSLPIHRDFPRLNWFGLPCSRMSM